MHGSVATSKAAEPCISIVPKFQSMVQQPLMWLIQPYNEIDSITNLLMTPFRWLFVGVLKVSLNEIKPGCMFC